LFAAAVAASKYFYFDAVSLLCVPGIAYDKWLNTLKNMRENGGVFF